jgi:hypothetical protein
MCEVAHGLLLRFREYCDLGDTYVVSDVSQKPHEEEVIVRRAVLDEFVFLVPGVEADEVIVRDEVGDGRFLELESLDHVSNRVFEPLVSEMVVVESLNENADVFFRNSVKFRERGEFLKARFRAERLVCV